MKTPYYVLAATPETPTRVKGFFREGTDSPGWLLTDPPVFRHAGFDLNTRSISHLIDGEFWQAATQYQDRKQVRLYQDGTLVAKLRADSVFLGWGQDANGFAVLPVLNPVAIVESHAAFSRLFAAVAQFLADQSGRALFSLRFHDAVLDGNTRLNLSAYFKGGIRSVFDPKLFPIHSSEAEAAIKIAVDRVISKPTAVAYELLEKFYDLFDAEPTLIPFIKNANGEEEVDIQALQRLSP